MAQPALGDHCKVDNFIDRYAVSAAMFHRAYDRMVHYNPDSERVGFALYQQNDKRMEPYVTVHDMEILPHRGENIGLNRAVVDHTLKYLLWQRGGWRGDFVGPEDLARHLQELYKPSERTEDGKKLAGDKVDPRRFDADFMQDDVYNKSFEVRLVPLLPSSNEYVRLVSTQADGCRASVDLGASDYKWAAIIDGKVIASGKLQWSPRVSDRQYHIDMINKGIATAAQYLPRIDTLGISSAGILFEQEFLVASILRDVPKEERAGILAEVQKSWGGIPLVAANDGDVTALAGVLATGKPTMLGYAGGSDRAAGQIRDMQLYNWLMELAFVEYDYNPWPAAAANWGGVPGVGTVKLSQQALPFFVHAAGLDDLVDLKLGEADKNVLRPALLEIQDMAATQSHPGHIRAVKIFEEFGWWHAHAAARDVQMGCPPDIYLMGAVLDGVGGDIAESTARKVTEGEFPELGINFVRPTDSKEITEGQAVAVAKLAVRQEKVYFQDTAITQGLPPPEKAA
jgi:hypothetical protein